MHVYQKVDRLNGHSITHSLPLTCTYCPLAIGCSMSVNSDPIYVRFRNFVHSKVQ